MRGECLNHKFVFGSSMQTGRLVQALADKHQECTQSHVRRPYGVGLLVAGFDVRRPGVAGGPAGHELMSTSSRCAEDDWGSLVPDRPSRELF